MRLKEIRTMAKMSQSTLAQKLGVSDVTISNYERGLYDPNVDMLLRMADVFGISVDTLVGHDAQLVDLNALSATQQELVRRIVYSLNENQLQLLKGYADALIQTNKQNPR